MAQSKNRNKLPVRGEKYVSHYDTVICTLWYPESPTEDDPAGGECFDFYAEDIPQIIELLKELQSKIPLGTDA